VTRPIRLYFFRSSTGRPNFGDELSASVVAFVTGRQVEHAGPWNCDLTGIGSILDRFTRPKGRLITAVRKTLLGRDVAVWGSGLIKQDGPRRHELRLLALRGQSTRAEMQADKAIALGDPGLLVGKMIRRPAQRHAIGVVPHYSDKSDPMVQALRAIPGVRIIDVETDGMTATEEIAACGMILSSSLHGLIVADALGIPNHRLSFTGRLKGGDFKFLDYASAIGRHHIAASRLAMPEDALAFAAASTDFSYQAASDGLCAGLERALREGI
jgi:hypothetical protein